MTFPGAGEIRVLLFAQNGAADMTEATVTMINNYTVSRGGHLSDAPTLRTDRHVLATSLSMPK